MPISEMLNLIRQGKVQQARKLLEENPELALKIAKYAAGLEEVEKNLAKRLMELEKAYAIDHLTGVYNRKKFDDDLFRMLKDRSIASDVPKRKGDNLALAILDIDHFKRVNDQYGHLVGDLVLEQVGSILRENVSEPCRTYRYGGEEFAIIFPGYSDLDVLQKVEDLREILQKKEIEIDDGFKICVTMSAGIDSFPYPLDEVLKFHREGGTERFFKRYHKRFPEIESILNSELSEKRKLHRILKHKEFCDFLPLWLSYKIIHRTDAALYRAKKDGRNRVYAYRDLFLNAR